MTQIDVQRSPMEQFQDNLKKQLRDDIARMLPDEAVKEMIGRVVKEEFFQKRKIKKPGSNDWSNETIEKGTVFQDMVFEAAKPVLARLAKQWVDDNQQALMDNWKSIIDEGLMTYVSELQKAHANTQIVAAFSVMLKTINDERTRNGLPMIFVPL